MMNILFLDMDGVLCTPRSSLMANQIHRGMTHNYLDKQAVDYILSIVRQYEFKIVVSSVWRGREHFRDMMRLFGYTSLDFHKDWRTSYVDVGSRGREIEDWISRNSSDVENYVIFEDEPFALTDDQKEKHLVKCDLYNGITFQSIEQFDKRVKELGL